MSLKHESRSFMNFIITADDFGLSKSTNEAIMRGIDMGIINSTNIMVNMPYANDGISLIKRKGLYLGIHYNLTTGRPISDVKSIPSLVDTDGNFWNFKNFKKRAMLGLIRFDEVRLELNAQLEKFVNMFGQPKYWNSHNHIQMILPMFRLMIDFSTNAGIMWMRNNHKVYLGTNFKYVVKNVFIDSMYKYAKAKGCLFLDGVVVFHDPQSRYSVSSYCIDGNGLAEIIVHIANECDSDYFGNMIEERVRQRDFYLSDEFKSVVRKKR